MKILVVADEWPWPTHQGDRVRLAAILRVLADRHEVTLLGRPDNGGSQEMVGVRALELYGTKHLVRLIRHPMLPATVAIRMNGSVETKVLETAASYDRVLFYQLKSAAWLSRRLEPSKVIVDLTDSLGLYYRRRGGVWAVESKRTMHMERALARRYQVCVCSEFDRSAIDPLDQHKVTVARNGYWIRTSVDRHPEPNTIIAVGNWDYYPNRAGLGHFLESIWPRISSARPLARLWIIGRGRNPLSTASRGVEWIGEVDDLSGWYQRAVLAVAPVYVGAGMKTKIMEALFYGVPVVATQLAVEGIDANPMLASASHDAQFAERVIQDLDTPRIWDQESRSSFLAGNTWAATLAPLVALIERETVV